ncbi:MULTISPECIES: crossover junction endodeoxyribonuclease RuvC [Bacillaceae]|uniref:Crossover junction endodeoxyribonuclease RuvC n=1 Tax=Lederbergia citri TaxID=2833580 RepID=A0A942T9J1_9BACI|nr:MULTISPECIES: crossover junction endodeoxyribonuclease RuvC [Bacillaceae]MBS4193688.1 crossover junction endodeoxyribonuclease RuvC [Lederbergia citri]
MQTIIAVKSPTIMAIDASLTSSGIAITKFNKEIVMLHTIKTTANMPIHQRILFVYINLDKIIEDYKVKVILMESNYTGGSKEVNWIIGIIYLIAAMRGINVVTYAPASIKKAVTGNGRASKKEIKIAIHKIFGDLKTNEHVRDALGIIHCYFIKKVEAI